MSHGTTIPSEGTYEKCVDDGEVKGSKCTWVNALVDDLEHAAICKVYLILVLPQILAGVGSEGTELIVKSAEPNDIESRTGEP